MDILILSLVAGSLAIFGLLIASRDTNPPEEDATTKKDKTHLDLKGMFKAKPGVHISIEEMRLGYDSEAPWRVSSLVMTEPDCFLVRFKDSLSGVVRFEPSFFTGVFEPLQDPAFFKQVFIEGGAVTWPGGIVLAPDNMHDKIEKYGEWVLR